MDVIRKTFLLMVGALSIAWEEITQAVEEARRYVDMQEDEYVQRKPDRRPNGADTTPDNL